MLDFKNEFMSKVKVFLIFYHLHQYRGIFDAD